MKVLFCVGFPVDLNNQISGTGNWITSLFKNLSSYDEANMELAICMIDHSAKSLEASMDGRFKKYTIPTRKGSKLKLLLANYALIDLYKDLHLKMNQIVIDFKPDIIQIFGYESQFVRLFGKINIPIVIHFQGFKQAYDYKYFQRISKRELAKETSIMSWLLGSAPFFALRRQFINYDLKNFDTKLVKYVFGRTDWDRLCTKAISPDAKYFYCQEMLRKDFYENSWSYPENDCFQLFTITGEGSTKNLDMIFEVARLLDKYHPNFKYSWRIAGIDDSNTVVKIMKKRGFRSNSIQFLGKLYSNNLVEEILKCNLYVYPSGMDNSPNSLMEAMLVGAPVLSNYAGGIDTIVEHGVTGFLVNEGEPYAMTGAIVELSNKKDFLNEIAFNSKKRSMIRNSHEGICNQLISGYKQILEIEKGS